MTYVSSEWAEALDSTKVLAHFIVKPDNLPSYSASYEDTYIGRLNPNEMGMAIKAATLEPTRTKCDGTFKWPARLEEPNFYGPWADYLGNWSLAQTEEPKHSVITLEFSTPADLNGVTIIFDDKGWEYAIGDSFIEFEDADYNILLRHDFTAESPYYTFSESIGSVKRITLVVDEWSNPDAVWWKIAKVVPYVDFSWSGSDILTYDKQMAITPFESSMTIPEARLTVVDPHHYFVPYSFESVADQLKQGMPITVYWEVPEGRMIASEWLLYEWVAENDEATFTMRPALGFSQSFSQTTTTTGTATSIASSLLSKAGMSNLGMTGSQTVYTYFGENLNVDTGVQQLANSVGDVVIPTNDNTGVYFRRLLDAEGEERFIDEDYYWEPPKAVKAKPYKEIVVSYSALEDGNIVEKTYTKTINSKGKGTYTVYAQNAMSAAQAQAIEALAERYLAYNVTISASLRGDPDMKPWQFVSMGIEDTSVIGIVTSVKTSYSEGILTTDCEVITNGNGE